MKKKTIHINLGIDEATMEEEDALAINPERYLNFVAERVRDQFPDLKLKFTVELRDNAETNIEFPDTDDLNELAEYYRLKPVLLDAVLTAESEAFCDEEVYQE